MDLKQENKIQDNHRKWALQANSFSEVGAVKQSQPQSVKPVWYVRNQIPEP